VHCAATVDGFTHARRAIALNMPQILVVVIASAARVERFRKSWFHWMQVRPSFR
jgi:hypothetical protein